MPSDTYSVVVDTRTDADDTISKLMQLDKAIRDDTRALSAMRRGLSNLKAGGIEATQAIDKLKDQIALQKAIVASTQAKYIEAGGTFKVMAQSAGTAKAAVADVGSQAKASAVDANAAVAKQKAAVDEYGLALSRLSGEIISAANAGKKFDIQQELRRNSEAIAKTTVQMNILRRAGADATPAFKDLEKEITKLRASEAALGRLSNSTAGKVKKLVQAARAGTAGAKAGKRAFEGWGNAGTLLGGRVGGLVGSMETLGMVQQSAGVATVAATAGVVLLAAAVAAGVVALSAYVIKLADTKRETQLALEATVALGNVMTKGPMLNAGKTAEQLTGKINSVSQELGTTRAATRGLAVDLFEMGLRGATLSTALKTAATAQLAAGDKGVAAFKKQLKPIKKNAAAVDALASKFDKQLGGVAGKRALSLGVQFDVLSESVKRIFSNLNIDGFLKALRNVTQMLEEGSAVSFALGVAFDAIFAPLGFAAESGTNMAVIAFKHLLLWGLTLANEIVLTRNAVIDTFERWNKMSLSAIIGELTGFSFAVEFKLINGLLVAAGNAAGTFWTAIKAAFNPKPAEILGTDVVDGIVKGIKSAAGRLTKSVADLAGGAIKMFKSTIKSSSPSKVFQAEGVNIGEGASIGVDDTAPMVHKSMVRMATPPQALEQAQVKSTKAIATVAKASAVIPAVPKVNARSLSPNLPDQPATLPAVKVQAPPTPQPVQDQRSGPHRPPPPGQSPQAGGGRVVNLHIAEGAFQIVVPGAAATPEQIAAGIRQPLIDEFKSLANQLGAKS